ncbi:hypothetical protein B0H13DRAFT_1907387 [Mycena leptocephala]|nr:hypothetical protein B0H13DRAFT_1907387 [Mycena leptocephala]
MYTAGNMADHPPWSRRIKKKKIVNRRLLKVDNNRLIGPLFPTRDGRIRFAHARLLRQQADTAVLLLLRTAPTNQIRSSIKLLVWSRLHRVGYRKNFRNFKTDKQAARWMDHGLTRVQFRTAPALATCDTACVGRAYTGRTLSYIHGQVPQTPLNGATRLQQLALALAPAKAVTKSPPPPP